MKRLITILTLVVFSSVAYAQLGGVVRSTTGAAGQATAGRGGVGSTLGVDQTLDTTVGHGQLGVDSTLNSTAEATTNATDTVKDKSKKTTDKVADKKDKAVAKTKDKSKEAKDEVKETASTTKEDAKETMKSTSVETSTNASANGEASKQPGSTSSSLGLNGSNSLNVNAGNAHVESNASAQSNASADVKKSEKSDSDQPKKSEAAVENSNSGDGKLHGLDRAESRVDDDSHAEAVLQNNEQRQASGKVKTLSDVHASAKKNKNKKK